MGNDFKKNLRQRHEELKKLGKVMEAVKLTGGTYKTYSRALRGDAYVRATTIEHILKAQAKVLELTKSKLQLV